jgi:hypothetical protein
MTLMQLRRVRWAVRLTLVLGVAASVATNVLHANPNPVSQTIAAWPPLALLLTVELVSRVPVRRGAMAVLRIAATITIAGIAAYVSYWHMTGVADRYGETGPSPYLLPLSVDGLIVVASISLVELAGRIRDDAGPSVHSGRQDAIDTTPTHHTDPAPDAARASRPATALVPVPTGAFTRVDGTPARGLGGAP